MTYVDMYIWHWLHESVTVPYSHILREASALSVLLHRAIPGPQQAERATGTALTLFLFENQSEVKEESPAAVLTV